MKELADLERLGYVFWLEDDRVHYGYMGAQPVPDGADTILIFLRNHHEEMETYLRSWNQTATVPDHIWFSTRKALVYARQALIANNLDLAHQELNRALRLMTEAVRLASIRKSHNSNETDGFDDRQLEATNGRTS